MGQLPEQSFTVRKPAWWDLTGAWDKDRSPNSIDELLEWTGTDWKVLRAPTFRTKIAEPCQSQQNKEGCNQGAVAIIEGGPTYENRKFYACAKHANQAGQKGLRPQPLPLKQVPGKDAIYREDTGEEFDVANSSYEIFQNREAAELVEMILTGETSNGSNLDVEFITGGNLDGGARVWYLARINEEFQVPGDSSPIMPYVSVLNSHNGTAALRVINDSIRIVCDNTWKASERNAEKSNRIFTFRHTGTIRDRIEDARKALFTAREETAQWVEYGTKMIAIPVEDHQVDRYLAEFVPMPPQHLITDRVASNVEQSRQAIKNFYHSPSCASIAGTAWGLIQATGEFLDHGRAYRTKETYVSRTMLSAEKGKLQAIKLVEELVGA